MMEDIISAKDFQIKNLKNLLAAEKKLNSDLLARLEAVVYFAAVSGDLWEKSRRNVLAASRGEIKKPALRISEEINSGDNKPN